MVEHVQQPETLEEIVRRVLSEQKTHGHRHWGQGRAALIVPPFTVANLNVTAVVNTWYTIANLVNVEPVALESQILTTDETLEVRITMDGVTATSAPLAATAGNYYATRITYTPTVWGVANSAAWANDLFNNVTTSLKSRVFMAEIRKTTNAGGGNLQSALFYQQY